MHASQTIGEIDISVTESKIRAQNKDTPTYDMITETLEGLLQWTLTGINRN